MKIIFTIMSVFTVMLVQAQGFVCGYNSGTELTSNNKLETATIASNNDLGDLRAWIPYCNEEPLKNPPITCINVSFHVFLDDNGGGNRYANNSEGRKKLIDLLNTVNDVYSGKLARKNGPSDKVPNVKELPNYDTRIRFSLGDYNERIYFYQSSEWFRLEDKLVGDAGNKLYNYIATDNLPNLQKGINVFFIASSYKASVKTIVVTNFGSGYTQQPTIELIKPDGAVLDNTKCKAEIRGGKIVSITVEKSGTMSGCEPPKVRITGGGGSGATAKVTNLEGGATAFANPQFEKNSYVVVFNCIPNDGIYVEGVTGRCMAHEFGHNLYLTHTYCGGGASATGCTDMKGKHSCAYSYDHKYDDAEYLSDIFGPCNASTFPHIAKWTDPYDNSGEDAKKITNNVMGGSNNAIYFSPMQAGQMHRAIALGSVGKYVQNNIHSDKPLVIKKTETWKYNCVRLFHDVHIQKNGNLTLDTYYEFNQNCSIEIENGGVLCLAGNGYMGISSSNKIIVKKGGTLVICGSLNVSGTGMIDVQPGGYLCIKKDANVNLKDYLSLIKFSNGAILGVNTIATNSPGTYYNAISSIKYKGNGTIATYANNTYIQNQTISKSSYISGNNIYTGNSVTTTKTKGDVVVKSGISLVLDAGNDVLLDKGFLLGSGAQLEIK